jgi:hypothetical protein
MALQLSGSIDAGGSAVTPQFVGSASYAATASYALNAGGGGTTVDTGSLLTTASATTNVLTFTKGDASTFDITVQTGSIPAGTVSSSAQTIANLPAGTISGSAQLPADIVSSSAQTIANLSGTDIISSSAQLPSGVVSSSAQISDITASSIINAETSSVAQANEIVFTKGDGSTFSITQDTSSFIKTVNAVSPDANGNVSTTLTATKTGTSASMLAYSSSGLFNDAEIWIISGQSGSDPLAGSGSNGKSFIFVSSSGELSQLASVDQPIYDARYVFKFGDTMTGQLILNGNPSDVLGAAPKQYVDVAYTGSLITSASDGTNTLTLRTRGGATETHTFNSASFAISASHSETSDLAQDSKDIITNVRNTSGATITKGTPVYATGVTGDNINVSPASASSADTMPAIGLLAQDLTNNETGNVVLSGKLVGIDTTNGFVAGQNVYVGATGSLVSVKPTGENNRIQNMAVIGKVDASEGEVIVIGSGRSNDVPNILSGSAWVGDSNGVAEQVPTSSFRVDTASFALTASFSLAGGDIAKPVITGIVTQSIEQGDSATFSGLAIQSGNPAMWAIQNTGEMTASLGTTANISSTNSVTTNELNNTGSFTSQLYALTALGRSEANQLLVNVAQFNLSSSNLFGNDLSKYYLQVQTDATIPQPGDNGQYVFWGYGVHNGTTNTLDVENTTVTGIDTTDYIIWYNESAGRLLAYEYTSTGTLDSMVTVVVSDFTNKTTNQSTSTQSTVTSNEKLGGKLFDKYVGTGYYQYSSPHSNFYLQISGSGGLFNSFGTNGQGDWMYGFNLLDDWTIGTSGLQMLAPDDAGTGKGFVFAPNAYFITTTETSFITYGDSGTQADTSFGISWSSTDGVLAPSGSSIIVWFDDSANTTYLYVDGTQRANDTSADGYMGTAATTDPVLHFGNPVNRSLNDYTEERFVINFPYRINNLWIATAGTSLNSTNVSELSSHADISDSTNYGSIDFHSQNITTTPDKGAAVLSRKSFTRPNP